MRRWLVLSLGLGIAAAAAYALFAGPDGARSSRRAERVPPQEQHADAQGRSAPARPAAAPPSRTGGGEGAAGAEQIDESSRARLREILGEAEREETGNR